MTIFAERYRDTLSCLAAHGFMTSSDKLTMGLDAHIDDADQFGIWWDEESSEFLYGPLNSHAP